MDFRLFMFIGLPTRGEFTIPVRCTRLIGAAGAARGRTPLQAPQPQYGGAAVGIGYGLLEEFDYEDAIPKQLNFDEPLIATAMDVPHVNAIIVKNADAAGPFGAKSIVEPATEIAARHRQRHLQRHRQARVRNPRHPRTCPPRPQALPPRRPRLRAERLACR